MTPARSAQPEPGENEYDSILAAVMETARGRWFVAEFARRNRQTETEAVLDALARIERRIAGSQGGADPDMIELGQIFGLRPDGGAGDEGLTGDLVADIGRDIGGAAESTRDVILSARGALKGLSETGADARLCAALDRAMLAIDANAAKQVELGHKIEALSRVVGTIRDRVRRMLDDSAIRPADLWADAPERAPPAPPQAAAASVDPRPTPPERAKPPEPKAAATGASTPAAAPTPAPTSSIAPPRPQAAPILQPPIIDETPVLFDDDPPPANDVILPAPAATGPFEGGLPLAAVGAGARLRLAMADEERALSERPAPPPPPRTPRPTGDPRTLAELEWLNYSERHALFAS